MGSLERRLHALEREFGLSAEDILDVINRRNRCKIAVRGAIAEAHLIKMLGDLAGRGAIDSFKDFDRDGYPDCSVVYRGREFLVECKNVRAGKHGDITIDFQRTRNPIDKKWERYYLPTEFQIVAACLWNRTRTWEFRFAATRDLPRHSEYADRLATRLVVTDDDPWTDTLPEALEKLAATPPPSTGAAPG